MDNNSPENLLEFPCQFQFKAVGISGDEFYNNICRAIRKHVTLPDDAVHSRPSGQGTYQSVSALVTLHSYSQLTDIYASMKCVRGLKMLL